MWRAHLPADILPLIAAVAVGGMLAGMLASAPILFVTTPLVAACLAAGAVFERRAPEWKTAADATFADLPESGGEARYLLLDLIKRAAAASPSAPVAPLVVAACDAARQLSALEAHPESERCRRGCDLLTQRLEEASAALSRWQAVQGAEAAENLGRLARELNEESRYQQEAAHEVETLLA